MARTTFPLVSAALLVLGAAGLALAQAAPLDDPEPEVAEIGKPAPDFVLADLDGKEFKLSDHEGKVVVLEWFNPGCPFVVRNHEKDSLETLASDLAERGVVWAAINSGAPGKQGTGKETNAKAAKKWGMRHPILLDEEGTVGRKYGAKTTPHMYVIDAKGVLRYAGGIDNDPSGRLGPDERVNYVEQAVKALLKGEQVATPSSKPYGCGVKYGKKK
jgi:peroxiredoxin